jgi:dethiobiotin synthetase
LRGLFVTGTDTGVGKTVVSACLLAAMRSEGETVSAFKPVVTGLDEPPTGAGSEVWPRDHELLAAAAGLRPEEVSPLRFGAAAAPHLAARLAGASVDPSTLIGAAGARGSEGTLVVEGVGGLMVPLSDSYTVLDLALALGLPLLIAARAGLGTINHTLLTIAAARGSGLDIAAVILTPWPDEPSALERSNRETIARLGEVEVHGLELLSGPQLPELSRGGRSLPWRSWL